MTTFQTLTVGDNPGSVKYLKALTERQQLILHLLPVSFQLSHSPDQTPLILLCRAVINRMIPLWLRWVVEKEWEGSSVMDTVTNN